MLTAESLAAEQQHSQAAEAAAAGAALAAQHGLLEQQVRLPCALVAAAAEPCTKCVRLSCVCAQPLHVRCCCCDHCCLLFQLLCLLFQLQLALMLWDRRQAEQHVAAASEALARLEQQHANAPQLPSALVQLKLHFTLLQVRVCGAMPALPSRSAHSVAASDAPHTHTLCCCV